MGGSEGQGGSGGPSQGLAPGALSALLREIAAGPAPAGGGWASTLRPGAVFGKLELVRKVGEGGFGEVWEARDRELGRSVAFKAVRLGGRSGLREERLLREAESAARLHHPNLVTLFDLGKSEQGPYLVLELLRGQTLAERLALGRLSLREAVRVGAEVAKGLAHAHTQGVVHRDLKPANVFLCEDGQVKVLDFGLAHAFGQRRQDGGTPGYMAPEQWEGAPEDERTDVFALGVMLFGMLAGVLPFPEGDGRSVRGPRRAPALEVPELPALGDLVASMLEKRASRRPRDGSAAAAALRALQGELERTSASTGLVTTRPRAGRLAALLGVLGFLAAAPVITWYLWKARPPQVEAAAAFPSIAVLPFADMSPQHDQGYFAEGVAVELLEALARIPQLKVIGRASSLRFKGLLEDPKAIGEKLGAGYLVEGSVRRSGPRVRVAAQLVDARSGNQVWAESYDREFGDLLEVQGQIASNVARSLQLAVATDDARSLHQLKNPESYALYLRGRAAYDRGEGLREAQAAFERVLELEPGFSRAAEGLVLTRLAMIGGSLVSSRRGWPPVVDAAETTLRLDPKSPLAHLVLGLKLATYDYDWDGATRELDTALAVKSRDPIVLYNCAWLAFDVARYQDAVRFQEAALSLDPLNPDSWQNGGIIHYMLGNLDAAERALRKSLEVSPNFEVSHRYLGQILLLRQQPSEALKEMEAERHQNRNLGLALAYHALGRKRESDAAITRAEAEQGELDQTGIAVVHAYRGEMDQAFEWLEKAVAARDLSLGHKLTTEPLLAPLRADPRYRALLSKMNLPRRGSGNAR